MKLTPIEINSCEYPKEFKSFLSGAKIYDSSCSPEARVIFIDKDGGYFLKSAPKGKLEQEAVMTRYFHIKGLSANVLEYVSEQQDWLLTEKIYGDDGVAAKHLEQPKRLCDLFAERLIMLHELDFSDCPVQNHTTRYLENAEHNMRTENYNKSNFPDSFGYKNAEEAWAVVETHGNLLQNNALLHGDYCLPNIILNDWNLSGFIDVGHAGAGDRHVDIFSGIWTLFFNLQTHNFRRRFLDAYGRTKVDEDILRIVAAIEVFG
ncbi:MAG: aminoglycoside 3'-phosphotransferase [Clostridiales bacterium]|jgi:kanamycin kinase|nr:aminoglycoside 3'-phosphotransferase [Clostridiales bacterium]